MKYRTLRLKWPLGLTIIYTIPTLILILGALEAVSRTNIFFNILSTPNIGSAHEELNTKLYRLETFAREGDVDCFVVGSSLSAVAIDPDTLSQAFEEQTGRPLRCFNFGLSAFTAVESVFISEMLIEEYHPDLIIFGSTIQDIQPDEIAGRTAVMSTPWAQQYLGSRTLTGWLTHHSTMYRYYLAFVLQRNETITKEQFTRYYHWIMPDGWRPRDGASDDPAEFVLEGQRRENLVAFFDAYDFDQAVEDRTALQRLMAYHTEGPDVVLVDMPLSEVYWDLFPDGYDTYAEVYAQPLADMAEKSGVPFIQTNPGHPYTLNLYYDYHHLNSGGAVLFSRWLGEQIGQMAVDGRLPALEPSQD